MDAAEAADGETAAVESADVNDYLREHLGPDASAKVFRTWGGSVLAARALAGANLPSGRRALVRALNDALREVARDLGNTLAVCREHYVHPEVIDGFREGSLRRRWRAAARSRRRRGLSADEHATLRVLETAGD